MSRSGFLEGSQVVVIGAGVVGATTAYRLAQSGAKVTIVDRRLPGSGTSAASFGWLNAFTKSPRQYHQLNARGIREHQNLAAELNADWLHLDGSLLWTDEHDAARTEQFRGRLRQLAQWGYRIDLTKPDVVTRDLEPDLSFVGLDLTEIAVVPGEGWLDGVRMAHGLVQAACRRYCASLVRGEVVALQESGRGISAAVLADGTTLPLDVLVNAAGPDAAHIAGLAGVDLALRRQPGLLATTSPVSTSLRHVVWSSHVHLRPDGGSRLLVQQETYDSRAAEERDGEASRWVASRAIADAAQVLLAARDASVESIRLGIRPMPVDGFPIVGFEPDVAGLYELVTHSGMTLCAILARLVTEELTGSEVPELEPYRPERFKIASGERAVAE